MPILNKKELQEQINAGQLVLHPLRDADGNPVVEPASYDLRAGIIVWKNEDTLTIEQKDFDEGKDSLQQPVVTLRPGQMVFVISHEELKLPDTISATVYSRNKLQKQNVLALNAGHIDPGYEGPIMIRLINLSAIAWTIRLGDAIFTTVFHTVKDGDESNRHPRRTKQETLEAAMKTAAEAFSNPFHDLYKNQIDKQLGEYYSEVESKLRAKFSDEFFRKNDVTLVVVVFGAAAAATLALITKIPWLAIWNWLKSL